MTQTAHVQTSSAAAKSWASPHQATTPQNSQCEGVLRMGREVCLRVLCESGGCAMIGATLCVGAAVWARTS